MSRKGISYIAVSIIMMLTIAACVPLPPSGGDFDIKGVNEISVLDASDFFEELSIQKAPDDKYWIRFSPHDDLDVESFMLEVNDQQFGCEMDPEFEGGYRCLVKIEGPKSESVLAILAVFDDTAQIYLVDFEELDGYEMIDGGDDDDEDMRYSDDDDDDEMSYYDDDDDDDMPYYDDDDDDDDDDMEQKSVNYGNYTGGDLYCSGIVGSMNVDEIIVNSGEVCNLDGTKVMGNITIMWGGVLYASNINLEGNIQAENANRIEVNNSNIGGDFQFKDGNVVVVNNSWIGGNFQGSYNMGSISLTGSSIKGNVQLFENYGEISINGNFIQGDLQCKENSIFPTGGGNDVYGNLEDQCFNLS